MRNTMGLVLMCLLACTMATAQATRTWVSGVGDDVNPCSRTAPCKTFAKAISVTAAGGEIDALDPAGYGALTITKSITIDGGGGQVASVLVTGTNGIVVQAGASDVVTLRNLRINGVLGSPSGAGINGVDYKTGGTLIIENCDIFGFSANGIYMEAASNGHLTVRNSTATNDTNSGIRIDGGTATIEGTDVSDSPHGLMVFNGKVTVVRSVAGQNVSRGFFAAGGELNLTDSTASNDGYGVSCTGGTIRLSNVTITNNTTSGISHSGLCQVISWGNNHIAGNTATMAPTSTIAPQ